MIDSKYRAQVDLLLQTIPYVAKETNFALQLIEEIQSKLTDDDRSFLLGFKNGVPDWGKLPIKKANELPAVQWKLYNIDRLKQTNPEKHIEMLKNLEKNLLR